MLLQAEVAVDRDLVVGPADVGDLLAAEAGYVRSWVACDLCLGLDAIVVVCCCPVVAALFYHRNVVEAQEDHDPVLHTSDHYDSRCRCNAALEDSIRQDPCRQYLRLEQAASSSSFLGPVGESRVRGCLDILASPPV